MATKYLDNDGLLYFWQKIKELLSGKVNTESGKGLSTNDYTDIDRNKLAGIETGANNYVHPAYGAVNGKPSFDQTPSFGGSFTVSQVARDETGHIASLTDINITIPDTTMTASTNSKAGKAGLVPAPPAGSQNMFLKGNGEWAAASIEDKKVEVVLKPTNKKALFGIIGMILAIIGLCLICSSVIPLVVAVAAIALAIVAFVRREPKGFAITAVS